MKNFFYYTLILWLLLVSAAFAIDPNANLDEFSPIKIDFSAKDIKDVKISTFEYNNFLWVFFNKQAHIDIDKLQKTHSNIINIRIDYDQNYTLVKLKINGHKSPNIYLQDNAWVIDLINNNTHSSVPLVPISIDQGTIVLPKINSDYSNITKIKFDDDEIIIIPTSYPGYYIDNNYEFINFYLFKTYAGVLIKPKTDSLKISTNGSDINIQDLYINLNQIKIKFEVLFPFSLWFFGDKYDYYNTYVKLINDIITHNDVNYHLRLVKFYLANSLLDEALSYLQYMKKVLPPIALSDPNIKNEYNLLSLVAAYLLGDYQKSDDVLSNINTKLISDKQLAELNFWVDAINIGLGRSNINLKYIENIDTFLLSYMDNDKKFAFVALEQALANKDKILAKRLINIIEKKILTEKEKHYLHILKTDLMLLSNQPLNQVVSEYDQVIDQSIDDPKNRVIASYKKIIALYNNNAIKVIDAIKQLERLLIIWRGDDFEVKLTSFLGDLYIKNKDYYKGLKILRDTINYSGRYANALEISKKMTEVFVNLFHNGAASHMPDFDATILFYNFRELIPIGDIGIEMTLNLIDRLLKLDLIDQTTFFLNHIVKYRLKKDEEKSKYTLVLASLYLSDKQPDKVISVLKENKAFMDNKALAEAKYLLVNALMQKNKYDEALNMIQDDKSDRADQLRSDIFWQTKNWTALQTTAESKLEYRKDPPKSLSSLEQDYVYKLAIIYTATANYQNLLKLHDAFKDMLNNNLHRSIISNLVKISHLNSPESLPGYLKQMNKIYNKLQNSVIDDKFHNQF